ncbi:MAG: FimV/HubP family polar landmark protein [Sulfurifustis sp.]
MAGLVLGAALALSPLAGYSLGLGKLKVKSALNEPLNAEIDISSIADNELRGLKVSVAPRAEFEAVGAERLPFLSQLKFNVSKRPDGSYYLQVTSDAAIEEPFLHMLLQLEWPSGRLVREYTALIDPPAYMAGKPPAIEAPSAAPPAAEPESSKFVETVPPPSQDQAAETETAQASPALVPEPLTARAPSEEHEQTAGAAPSQPLLSETKEPAKDATAAETDKEVTVSAPTQPAEEKPREETRTVQALPATGTWANATEYNVRPGDTLWGIAERMRTDKQLTLEQVMVAIFHNNRDAFFHDNVNNLRAGKILKLPERDEIEATPSSEALREFRAQYDAWQEYKLKLAGGSKTLKVADSKAAPAPEAQAEKTETTEAPAEKKPTKSAQELLRVVRATGDAQKGATAKSAETESAKDVEKREQTALAERVTTLEESLQSKEMETRELSEKVGQVRSQIKNEKRLIELENQSLARQTAKPAEPKPAAAPAPAKPEAKPETAKTETKSEAPAPAPAPAAAPAKPAEPAQPAPTKPVRVTKKPAPAPAAPAGEKDFIDSVLADFGDSLVPVVGGAVALVGGLILIIYLRRRRRSIAEFEESILASDAIPNSEATSTTASTSTSESTSQAVSSGDTSFLSEFSKSGMGQVHTDEVDPVAEAEVYLAYGRDETAEEILKEAIIKNPDRQELKLKLLEIYHQRNDASAFETLAEEVYAAQGGRGGGKVWEKVEEMGKKISPDNPLFRGGAPARRAADRAVAQGMASVGGVAAAVGAGAAVAATQVVENSGSIDFDFDVSAPPAASRGAAEPSLDFDVNAPEIGGAAEKPAGEASDGLDFGSVNFESADNSAIDFDPGKDAAAAPAAADDEVKFEVDSAVAAPANEADAGSSGGNGADTHWDETATKLDLAKAYIDMGDSEGARSILDEVLAEGNDQQKKQAAELAAQIA